MTLYYLVTDRGLGVGVLELDETKVDLTRILLFLGRIDLYLIRIGMDISKVAFTDTIRRFMFDKYKILVAEITIEF